jgi:SIR2-like domain
LSLEIPATLLNSVYRGTAVLFLGAGASRGATHPNHNKIPDGLQLRDLISDEFLGGKLKDRPLAAVADFAINETSLISLQQYLQQLFNPFGPEKFYELISEFKWHGIATTNYDMIIERVYENSINSVQHLIPFIKNGQHVETEMKRHSDGVQYLKLHGSIAKLHRS